MELLADELLSPFLVLGVARGGGGSVVVDAGDDERHGCGGCSGKRTK